MVLLEFKEISVSGAVIIKGWFEDTVPGFFRDALSVGSSVLGLVHIDSDLYSSAKVVLNELGRFLRGERAVSNQRVSSVSRI